MEQKKAKMGTSALLIFGIVYTVLGGLFAVMGIVLSAALDESLFGLIFGGIGSIFLVLGLIFLYITHRRKARANALLAQGYYVWGQIMEFIPNFNVRVNGRHPFITLVRYIDSNGTAHVFRSASMPVYPDLALIGHQVKVYVERDNFKHYYVDLAEIWDQYVVH